MVVVVAPGVLTVGLESDVTVTPKSAEPRLAAVSCVVTSVAKTVAVVDSIFFVMVDTVPDCAAGTVMV